MDADTGAVKILRYAIARDVGKAVNPMIVDGQMVGALAQGIGGALQMNPEEEPIGKSGTPRVARPSRAR